LKLKGNLPWNHGLTVCLSGDRERPRLAGIPGRKAGSVAGFDYSTGLRTSGIDWNDATLEKWLSDPDMVDLVEREMHRRRS